MEVRNCRTCGRLFNYVAGHQICPNCKADLEKIFLSVKEYLYEHRDASLKDVVSDMGVSKKQLEQWVREERLTFSSVEGSGIGCEVCGTPIMSGKYCDACKNKIIGTLNGVYEEKKNVSEARQKRQQAAKMRFLE